MKLPVVKIVRLGQMAYAPALHIQKTLEQRLLIKGNEDNHTLVLVEHLPVYTLGLREKVDLEERKRLSELGAELVETDRGGLTTFHGPGQLVVYPVFHLKSFGNMTLRTFVANLEQVAIHTCRMLGLFAQVNVDSVSHTGAWVNDNKICAIGVHCRRYVTTHGLALNCNVDLDWFEHIVPCGIQEKGVTSLSRELGRDWSVDAVTSQFLSSFQAIFKCSMIDDQLSEHKCLSIN